MNKNFFSLLLIAAMTVTVSSFATDNNVEEKKETPKSNVPARIARELKDQEDVLAQNKEDLQNQVKARNEEVNKGDKQDKDALEDMNMRIAALQEVITIQDISVVALKNYIKNSYEQTRLDKIVAPVVKVANFVANNVKAALAVEAVAVVLVTIGAYKYFFASNEDEEEDFE